MPFTSHLAELRSRLIKSTLAIAIGFSICYAFVDDIFALLAAPVRQLQIEGLTLIGTTVTEAFFTRMKVSFVAAIIVASPVWLWQVWQFVAPGLYRSEKRALLQFLLATPVLFFLGAALAYYFVFPFAWRFFASFQLPSASRCPPSAGMTSMKMASLSGRKAAAACRPMGRTSASVAATGAR